MLTVFLPLVRLAGIGVTSIEPLALSLLNDVVDSPFTPGHALSASADLHADNPRQTSSMPDLAKYWVTSDNDAMVLRLPCLVDAGVPGVKVGKYFDLFGEKVCTNRPVIN